MSSYNYVCLVGNLTTDPELVYLPSGTPVVNCTIAVNRPAFDQGKEEVLFMDFAVFGKSADALVKYTNKGSSLLIAGRLVQERWKNKEGNEITKVKVVVDKFQFLSRKDAAEPTAKPETNNLPLQSEVF